MKINSEEKKPSNSEKRNKLFGETSTAKAVIINAIPMMISMLVFGIYSFLDSILAVNLAPGAYNGTETAQIIGEKDYIRVSMNAGWPIIIFMQAIALLFGVGVTTRASINIGANKIDRAKNSIKTGSQVGMGIMIVLIPVLLFSAKPWMSSQYPVDKFGTVIDDGFNYVSILIYVLPLQFAGQILSGLFRVEGRLKSMTFAMTFPILINLLFDWVFMGPGGMGIEGGAWATFISTALSPVILMMFMVFKKTELLYFKNFFGRFHIISIIGIILVGAAPFLRNFANAITQTSQYQVIQNVSTHIFTDETNVYVRQAISDYSGGSPGTNSDTFRSINAIYSGIYKLNPLGMEALGFSKLTGPLDKIYPQVQKFLLTTIPEEMFKYIPFPLKSGATFTQFASIVLVNLKAGSFMTIFASGAFPIYLLFFPSLFGIVTGVGPFAGYNYGAGKFTRVKHAFYWTMLYSFIWGGLVYILGAVALTDVLLSALGISSENVVGFGHSVSYYSKTLLRILMIGIPLYGFAVAGMTILSATDRISLSILSSSLRGFIFFFPLLYSFQALAIANPDIWWLFWVANPLGMALTSLTILIIVIFVLRRLDKKHTTLDERIEKLHQWAESKKSKIESRIEKTPKRKL